MTSVEYLDTESDIKWTGITKLLSHAFAPVFRYQPAHPLRDCYYCRKKMRHRAPHVEALVPLKYQRDREILTSTSIDRFFLFVGDQSEHTTELIELGKSLSKLQRVLSPNYILPTPENIRTEISEMLSYLKLNDRLFICIDGVFAAIPWDRIKCPVHITIWSAGGDIYPLSYSFWLDGDSFISKRIKNSDEIDASKRIIHFSNGDAGALVEIMKQYQGRISIFSLCREFRKRDLKLMCYSNYRFNPKITFFYFG